MFNYKIYFHIFYIVLETVVDQQPLLSSLNGKRCPPKALIQPTEQILEKRLSLKMSDFRDLRKQVEEANILKEREKEEIEKLRNEVQQLKTQLQKNADIVNKTFQAAQTA